ncbi:AfsR/SARP family transcriptional regulator [Streptomyces griseomycini]|uniref:DNA-binding SARP family transcriptional activator n=1 Tax=Streptomyces griseomycini TaxID=66895 RepID=A0A7W7PWX3_9ACTN|nr:AfsR/SARP family transcriptional regulator [Streptomyces griseomycini]MBB4902770.1 DNA-binding SARP family transcriptional activator [Streptomyces griseomycini]
MDIRLLGPLAAEVDGVSIVPSAGKPRQILALLALQPGHIVPVPTLIEELWEKAPPRSAMTTLQTYVLTLRRNLGTAMGPGVPGAAKEVIATRHGGYLLQLPADRIDTGRYETLLAAGQDAAGDGDDERCATLLRQALDMWQGEPLADVPLGPVLSVEALRLRESRLVAVERRIDAELRLGRHGALLAELTALTARHPHHEGLHAQAMVALYRSGRRAAALEVYQRLRTRLVADLGVEPSPQLGRLQQAVLTVDPVLDRAAPARRGATFDLYAA